jgi:hypothetical protein
MRLWPSNSLALVSEVLLIHFYWILNEVLLHWVTHWRHILTRLQTLRHCRDSRDNLPVFCIHHIKFKMSLFYLFVASGFELRVSFLLGRCSTALAIPLDFFCFSYFLDKFSHFLPGTSLELWPSFLYLPDNWDFRCMPPMSGSKMPLTVENYFI